MTYESTPLGEALERVESILEQDARRARAIRSIWQGATPGAVESTIAKEPVIRDAISESCRVWIQSDEILVRSGEDADYFFDRLEFAESTLHWLRNERCRPAGETPNEILEWILIHSWPAIGVKLWRDDLRDNSP